MAFVQDSGRTLLAETQQAGIITSEHMQIGLPLQQRVHSPRACGVGTAVVEDVIQQGLAASRVFDFCHTQSSKFHTTTQKKSKNTKKRENEAFSVHRATQQHETNTAAGCDMRPERH